ncbi:MAG TPA: bifunctional metallophosphatase/5'-nucleotidase [Caldilineae bacterium]|nr:bifunctional metallophosphatase/5'-nucleotidase [Caldilineae bacterium]
MTTPASAPSPGTLRLIRGTPNPVGAYGAQLFLFEGDAASAPIHHVELAEGVSLPPRRSFSAAHSARLCVLHINDLHGHVCRLTPEGDIPIFSKIVGRIRSLRHRFRDDPDMAILTLSAGDDLIGFVFDELLGDSDESFKIHVGYHLYSAAGMDAVTFGNHDLDMGAAALARSVERNARFPRLSANLVAEPPLQGLYHPAALFIRKGIRIGVVGLTTPGQIRQSPNSGFYIADPIQTAHNILPALRPLCDVLIILSHLGYSLQGGSGATVGAAGDVELARALPRGGVHLIVGGHTHHVLNEQGLTPNNIVNGIPIVQAGTLGRYLGEVTISLRPTATVTNARLQPTAYLPTDQQFEQDYVQPLASEVMPLLTRPLGRTANCEDLDTLNVQNCFAARESAFANFIAEGLAARARAHGHEVDLAFVDASSARVGVPVGDEITFGDWFNVMPFADTIALYWLTGVQLEQLVRDNALRCDRADEPHTERGFLHFSHELRYTLILGAERSQARAEDIRFQGQPLADLRNRTFLLASSSFVRMPAAAWESYAAPDLPLIHLNDLPHQPMNLFLRKELVTYLSEVGGVTKTGGAKRDGRVKIVE